MANKPVRPLPDFDRPPVIEVVYGTQFKQLSGLQTPTLGLFWQKIRHDYPKFQEMPVLGTVIERFDSEQMLPGPQVELLAGPPIPRVFFIDHTGNWVLQLQNDRFLHNWRKVTDDDVYPRFPAASTKFFEAWDRFLSFCREESLPPPAINQLELTYINHIHVRDPGSPLGEIESVFPDLRWRERHEFLPHPETLAWKTSFLLPEQQGRLHVSLRHATRRKDKLPLLLFELTARGMPSEATLSAMKDWFALGREWIVRGFTDLTGERTQNEIWGRKA